MSTLPPSNPVPGNAESGSTEPTSSQSENSVRNTPAALDRPSSDASTLSPLSPDSAVKLEPLSAKANDEVVLLTNPLPGATASVETGKTKQAGKPKPFRWAVWVICFLGLGLLTVILGLVYITAGTIT